MKNILFYIVISLCLLGCKNNTKETDTEIVSETTSNLPAAATEEIPENPTTAESIAYAAGYKNWNAVSQIQFTFNVDKDGNHFERSWSWMPKTNDVKMISEKDTVVYNRAKVDSTLQKTDAAFINDKYWLLAPFNLQWDKGIEISEEKDVIAPISKDTLNKLTLVYSNEGGYTPGDAYDLYFGNNHKIKEWNYRKGNATKPTMTTTWEGYENHEGLDIATIHKDSTGGFKLYFTDISVKK